MATTPNSDELREWVKTWQNAAPELEAIRRREIEATDTAEAIRQIFGGQRIDSNLPPRLTSGLVEQQAWFTRLRLRSGE